MSDVPLAGLEDLEAMLQDHVGANVLQDHASVQIGELPEELSNQVEDILGRAAYPNIPATAARVISELWVEYLTEMEALRVSIGLEAYAQRDPLVQYKTKGFEMFQNLMKDMRMSVVNRMFTFQPRDVSSVQTAISEGELGG